EAAGAGEASPGPGERLQRRRSGDRAEPEAAVDGARRQALCPVRHGPEGDGGPWQGSRGHEGYGLKREVGRPRTECEGDPPSWVANAGSAWRTSRRAKRSWP